MRVRQTIQWVGVGLAVLFGAGCATGGAASKGHEAATRGDWDTAVAYYRQALEENPDRLQEIGLERATREASLTHLAARNSKPKTSGSARCHFAGHDSIVQLSR
jgi:hypothetical protein